MELGIKLTEQEEKALLPALQQALNTNGVIGKERAIIKALYNVLVTVNPDMGYIKITD